MKSGRAFALVVSIALLAAACRERAIPDTKPTAVAAPNISQGGKSRLGHDVPPQAVWPPADDASRLSGEIVSKLIEPGTGDQRPEKNKNHVLGIAYAVYDKEGHVRRYVPLMVQAMDLAPATWAQVLTQMRKGEVRRAWIEMPDGSTDIIDFEIRSFSVIRPDGTAVDIERSE